MGEHRTDGYHCGDPCCQVREVHTHETRSTEKDLQPIGVSQVVYVDQSARIAELEGQVAGHQEAHARLWEQHAARVVERDGAMLDFQGRTRQLEKIEKHHEAVTAERDKLQGQLKCSIEERFSLCDKLAKLQGEREVHSRDWWRDRASRAESSLNTLRELARAVVDSIVFERAYMDGSFLLLDDSDIAINKDAELAQLKKDRDALAAALEEGE